MADPEPAAPAEEPRADAAPDAPAPAPAEKAPLQQGTFVVKLLSLNSQAHKARAAQRLEAEEAQAEGYEPPPPDAFEVWTRCRVDGAGGVWPGEGKAFSKLDADRFFDYSVSSKAIDATDVALSQLVNASLVADVFICPAGGAAGDEGKSELAATVTVDLSKLVNATLHIPPYAATTKVDWDMSGDIDAPRMR